MFKVIYDDDQETCTLECPWCGNSYESDFPRPEPMTVLISHFNHDENSGIPECPVTRLTPGETRWEAVNSDGGVRAYGRIVIKQIGNMIQSPEIIQDWPAR